MNFPKWAPLFRYLNLHENLKLYLWPIEKESFVRECANKAYTYRL